MALHLRDLALHLRDVALENRAESSLSIKMSQLHVLYKRLTHKDNLSQALEKFSYFCHIMRRQKQ